MAKDFIPDHEMDALDQDPQSARTQQEYAKGGTVTPTMYPKVPKLPVSGTPVSAQMAASTPDFIPDSESHVLQDASTPSNPDFIPDAQFVSDEDKENALQAKHGGLLNTLKAGAEGAAQGLVGPLAPAIETSFGVNPEDIRGRAEANPITHYGSEAAGLIGPALLTGGASTLGKFTQAGALEALGKVFPQATETLAAKVGVGAAKAAVDNALIQGSDEASKMILKDPSQSAETAIANVGMAAAIGGGLGGSLGAAGGLWKAALGDKTSKLIEDFKGRINDHVTNPDPVSSMSNELTDYYKKISNLHDDVYGPQGLKAQDIAKALPELNQKILTQAEDTTSKLNSTLEKMSAKPNIYPERLTSKLRNDLDTFTQALSKDNAGSADIFNAMQDLKQTVQSYSKFDKFVKPVDEAYDFVRDVKGLAKDLKISLEDSNVWGKAAKRQQDINKAFSDYLPALKDFEKKFTTEVSGAKEIDPGKINTYINQLGKPNAEIKQDMLKKFLDSSEKYKKTIHDSHLNLGIDSPVENAPMNVTLGTLGEKTTGAKLADAFIDKGLKSGGASTMGASVGAGLGSIFGHAGAGVGAILGQHAFQPFFNSVLPAIAKFVLANRTSPEGFKAATDFAMHVVKGESLLEKATKNIFKVGREILPQTVSIKDTDKLDKILRSVASNPDALIDKDSKTAHYLPDHSMAIDMSIGNGVNYLNSLRPSTDRPSPLDAKPVPSNVDRAKYQNALAIAQEPTIVLDRIKSGRLTQDDITTLGTLYPSLYNNMKQKITDQMIETINKGDTIPYKTRIGISMFLAQPLDSTMQPASLQATQIQPPQQAPQQQSSPQGVKSSPALQKLPNMYQTPGQARAQHAQKE